eukprot:3936891-Rhodomonas_salina.1
MKHTVNATPTRKAPADANEASKIMMNLSASPCAGFQSNGSSNADCNASTRRRFQLLRSIPADCDHFAGATGRWRCSAGSVKLVFRERLSWFQKRIVKLLKGSAHQVRNVKEPLYHCQGTRSELRKKHRFQTVRYKRNGMCEHSDDLSFEGVTVAVLSLSPTPGTRGIQVFSVGSSKYQLALDGDREAGVP